MFLTNVRSGKSFVAEQKIRELKKRILKFKSLDKIDKIRVRPNNIIHKAASNMKKTLSKKYRTETKKVEKEHLVSESLKI